MRKIIIEVNKGFFKNSNRALNEEDPFYLIEKFSHEIGKEDWRFLCRRKEFMNVVAEGNLEAVKEIAVRVLQQELVK